jgi:uncharacterized protein
MRLASNNRDTYLWPRGAELVFVVKLSKFCNLRCAYCYEHRELHVRETMRIETVERLFAGIDGFGDYLCARGISPKFSFVWHGGEPLLLPRDRYAQIAQLQQRHIRKFPYRNSVQTNLHGVVSDSLKFVLDSEWELGVSIDFADDVRVNAGGRDSNASVMAAAEALHRSGARFGVISVLGAHNRETLAGAYAWVSEFADGWRILPVFEGGPEGSISSLRLPEEEVVRVFLEVFERRARSGKHIPIAPVDDYLKSAALKIAGQGSQMDVTSDLLDNIYVVNVNGEVFTRPFAYDPKFCLGNANTDFMAAMVEGPVARSCQSAITRRRVLNCSHCEMLGSCDGSPMHEHGSVTTDGGHCVVPQRTMLEIEATLAGAGVDKSVISDWAREWLASPQQGRVIS